MYKGAGPGRFERKVFADDGLREELLPAFDALLKAKGHAFLIEIHNWITAQENSSASKNKAKKRVKTGVGVYHFILEGLTLRLDRNGGRLSQRLDVVIQPLPLSGARKLVANFFQRRRLLPLFVL